MLKIFRRSPKGFQKNKNFWKNITFFTSGVFILSAGIITIWFSSLQIPDFNTFDERKVINSTKIYDRTGEILLYDVNKDIRRTSIDFADMGINIKNATVAVEDSEFYNHSGIRIPSIIRATIIAKLTGKKLTGGSNHSRSGVSGFYPAVSHSSFSLWQEQGQTGRPKKLRTFQDA